MVFRPYLVLCQQQIFGERWKCPIEKEFLATVVVFRRRRKDFQDDGGIDQGILPSVQNLKWGTNDEYVRIRNQIVPADEQSDVGDQSRTFLLAQLAAQNDSSRGNNL